MSAIIKGIRDTLDEENARFVQTPLSHPLFLNSVPKGGTHLIRNILRMFAPAQQHYATEFLQLPNLRVHAPRALDPSRPMLSAGHMLFCDESVWALGPARHILLVRDPYDWVLARLRFFLSDEFQQANLMHLKDGRIGLNEMMNMMIMGIHTKSPSLLDIYMNNAVAWIGTSARIFRYEDLRDAVTDLDSARSEAFFDSLFDAAGIDRPGDWRERVLVGADRKQSRTARENLNLVVPCEIPEVLPDMQKKLVDVAAPGVREILGYG